MVIDGWRSSLAAAAARWRTLERDWQSVVVGATIVTMVAAFELQIPW